MLEQLWIVKKLWELLEKKRWTKYIFIMRLTNFRS